METYCQNTFCETPAVEEVPVSVKKPSDEVRALCATCHEAYTWGVQHGRMVGQHGTLWTLTVADRGVIEHVVVYTSEREAEKAMIDYLRKYHGFNGLDDINLAYQWLGQHDERLSVEIIQQDINLGNRGDDSKTIDLVHMDNFLQTPGVVVISINPDAPDRDATVDAQAYAGSHDITSAEPVVCVSGRNCQDALDTLDVELSKLKAGSDGSGSE